VTAALQARGLLKRRGNFSLGPIDLDLEHGLITALIGPNGAGKTTTIDLLAGLLAPDAGQLKVNGQDVWHTAPHWKGSLGYVSEHQPFFERWTGARNLAFLRQHYPTWSEALVTDLARRLDLPLRQPVQTLSKGNRLKLAIVAALGHRPSLLLLDEPTSGLDPIARAELQEVLWEQLEEVTPTILYSTHILPDVSRLADRFLFLREGRLVLSTDRDTLTESWRYIQAQPHASATLAGLRDLAGIVQVRRDEHGGVSILSSDHHATLRDLHALGTTIHGITRPTFDDVAVQILKAREIQGGTHVAAHPR